MAIMPDARTVTDPLDSVKAENKIPSIDSNDYDIMKFTQWFRESVEYMNDWRKEAHECFDFVEGKQWSEGDVEKLKKMGRPVVTINKIRPMINMLSGYQRNNRNDIDFLPRTNDDAQLCEVRKAMTKYVMDRSNYEICESATFEKGCISGLGWVEVGYEYDEEIDGEGEAFVKDVSPFDIYIDPESRKREFEDSKYIIRAKWIDKDKLCEVYPEYKDIILAKIDEYDKNEQEEYNTRLYYQRDKKKIRLCECWYKVRVMRNIYYLANGTTLELTNDDEQQMSLEEMMYLQQNVIGKTTGFKTQVRVCAFFDDVKLEDMESPYEHGEFPFVPFVVYRNDENKMPQGIVTAAKDPQRELNKRRSEFIDIVSKSSHSGWIYEKEAMDSNQKHNFSHNASKAGALLEVKNLNKMREILPPNPPLSLVQAIQDSANDMKEVTGINEAMLGTDINSSASGRSIELQQKQAITNLIPLFDALRSMKKGIVYRLWGKRGHKGIIPQYYTEEKVYRIEGPNGSYNFMTVNQKQQINDPLRGVITQTLNDLSQGEFDVVIADINASSTVREAKFWALCDAISKLGIPGDMVFDMLIDLSDVPGKEEIKQRYQQRQQAQQQAQQAQMQQQLQLVQAQNNRTNKSINIKDVPLPVQLAMLAKENLVDPQLAQYMMELYVKTMAPKVAVQEEAQQAQSLVQQQANAGNQQQMTQEQLNNLQRRIAAQRAIGGNNTN